MKLLLSLVGTVAGLALVVRVVFAIIELVQNRWGKAYVEVLVATCTRGEGLNVRAEVAVILKVVSHSPHPFTVRSAWLKGRALTESLSLDTGGPIPPGEPREYCWPASSIDPHLRDVRAGVSVKLKPRIKVAWWTRPRKRVTWTRRDGTGT